MLSQLKQNAFKFLIKQNQRSLTTLTASTAETFASRLAGVLGKENVSTGVSVRDTHGRDQARIWTKRGCKYKAIGQRNIFFTKLQCLIF